MLLKLVRGTIQALVIGVMMAVGLGLALFIPLTVYQILR